MTFFLKKLIITCFSLVISVDMLLGADNLRSNGALFALAIVKGKSIIMLELDERLKVISRNKISAKDVPVFVIGESWLEHGYLTREAREFFDMMKKLSKKHPELYNEISEVKLTDSSTAVVFLRSRKTEFALKPDLRSFLMLKYAAGYVDRVENFPDKIKIYDDIVVVR